MKNTVHFILQGKGGIGKSFIAALLAQYFKGKGAELKAFDTDQENTTFGHYKALEVQCISVKDKSNIINAKGFDPLIERLLTEDGTFVIDNGANTFSPLISYMVESDILEMLRDNGKTVYIHTIVGGGDTMADTANGFNAIVKGIGDTPVVLWLNEHFGEMITPDGKNFQETKVFKTHESQLHGVITLQARNHQTYGDDLKRMNAKRLTLDEVMQSPDFVAVEKQRIRTVAKDVFNQLDQIEF